jgi:hypothetical protein
MGNGRKRWSFSRTVLLGAIAVGVAAGSYGVASAATGSGSGSTANPRAGPGNGQAWGHRRSEETLLTGDTAAKVRQLALAKVPGGTVIRVETDADGNAAYEAHMVKADGTPVTVYVSKQFEVVGVQTGMPRSPDRTQSGGA